MKENKDKNINKNLFYVFFLKLIKLFFYYFFIIFLLLISFWKLNKEDKWFSIVKNNLNDSELIVYGLNEEEIEEFNWSNIGIYFNKNEYFYYPEIKNNKLRISSFFVGKGKIDEYDILGKKIIFENIKDKSYVVKKSFRKDFFFYNFSSLFYEFLKNFIIFFLLDIIIRFINKNVNLSYFVSEFIIKDNSKNLEINKINKIKFKDIGGYWEEKNELREIIDFLKDPEISKKGISIPKGILLVGPPGNGKTLLAKALAAESNLPFIFQSGSNFEEMFVGLGAKRVRDLFKKAREFTQGCIIFIDEIDSIGRKRYSNNNNSVETINQLLNELDGFVEREKILIIAATNSLNVLDKALLRPGRFDRKIFIDFPNKNSRKEIIKLCIKKIPKIDFDLEETIFLTKGLSGAQIKNIFNESIILSLKSENLINQEMIFESYDKMLMGPVSKSKIISKKEEKIISYHEAGHATVALFLKLNVKRIVTAPRSNTGGYTWIDFFEGKDDDQMISKNDMLKQVMCLLGGRISEELIFGINNVTYGAYDDFKKASKIIDDIIIHYSMSELGIIKTKRSFYSGEMDADISEYLKIKIEKETKKIFDDCWKKVKDILKKEKELLSLIAEVISIKKSILAKDVYFIYINRNSPYVSLLR